MSAPRTVSIGDLAGPGELEPGENPTDKASVIDVDPGLLADLLPTGEELKLLAHGRERGAAGKVYHSRAVVISCRLPEPDTQCSAHLVMLERRYQRVSEALTWGFPRDVDGSSVRLVSLKSWQFTCTQDVPTLRGRLLGDGFTFDRMRGPDPVVGTPTDAQRQIRDLGYTVLPYAMRSGGRAHTLYHGPLVAAQSREPELGNNAPASAEGLVRILKDQKIFDVTLAAAWQLGRLSLLRAQGVALEYYAWRRRDSQRRLRGATWAEDGHLHADDVHLSGLTQMPASVTSWCRDQTLLHGIPAEHLVPDARMLPPDALRIFEVDGDWIEAFLAGALSLGRAGDAERAFEASYRQTITPSDLRQRTGFLLRSPAIEEHPDLQTVARDAEGRVLVPLRLERIGPGILLGMYSSRFARLEFSLPPTGLCFGLKEIDADVGERFEKDLRRADGAEADADPIPVALRASALGDKRRVVDISRLADSFAARLGQTMTPGQFAFQMCEGSEQVVFDIS